MRSPGASAQPSSTWANPPSQPWAMSPEELEEALGASLEAGLSNSEAEQRRRKCGPNRLRDTGGHGILRLLLAQILNPLMLILLFAAAVSHYTAQSADALAILGILLLNAAIGFWQEYRAELSLAALNRMAAPGATVRRDGVWKKIAAQEIVPGDIVRLAPGDGVPADLRLMDTHSLEIDEAALTGESEPSRKDETILPHRSPVPGDQVNMGFMGTRVTAGTATGLVTAIGMRTEIGRIADLATRAEEPVTPLQSRIQNLSKILVAASLFIVALVVGIGLAQGIGAIEMLYTGISLSVAAIPEGLPTVVTIVLTMGSRAMASQNALARRLASVETLGTTSVICADKTGTLTRNRMKVMKIWADGRTWAFDRPVPCLLSEDSFNSTLNAEAQEALRRVLEISVFCSNAVSDGNGDATGSPTEVALLQAGELMNVSRDEMRAQGYRTLSRLPFSSLSKLMSARVITPDRDQMLMVKGAPDILLDHCARIRLDGREMPLTHDAKARVQAQIEDFAKDALRTLAVAYDLAPSDPGAAPGHNLVFAGLHGIMDPPREEAAEAITQARSAGVRTIMITGDHAATASAIATRLGIRQADRSAVCTGADIDAMDEDTLATAVSHTDVFARVTPEHKLRIVNALQRGGEVAAMTGDGVNDAPALRKADIGIAMGITGTQVARDSADLILLDDNFSTIVTAVREGRRIYENIRKYLRQELTANVAEVSTILIAFVLLGSEPLLPLTPLMILWVNLVSDGIPGFSLGVEPAEDGLMKRPPRKRSESIFAGSIKSAVLLRGLAIGLASYVSFHLALEAGATLNDAQTGAFMTLVFGQLWNIYDARSSHSIFSRNPFGNLTLVGATALSATLSLFAVYAPMGNVLLGTVPLPPMALLSTFALAALPTLLLSAAKILFKARFL